MNKKKKSLIMAMTAIFFIAVIAIFVVYDFKTEDKPVSNIPEQDVQTNNEAKPLAQPDLPVPLDTDEEYAVFKNSLFIGDSRTEGFKLYSGVNNAIFFCAKSMTVDKIVSGEKIKAQGAEQSIYEVLDGNSFEKVYIGFGLNELGWVHIENFISEYGALIDAVKTSQPDAQIYIQALLPVTKERSSRDRTNNNEQIYWYNTNLVKLAQSKDVVYVNASEPLVDESGALKPDSTTDGIHLNSKYCKIWAKYRAEIS